MDVVEEPAPEPLRDGGAGGVPGQGLPQESGIGEDLSSGLTLDGEIQLKLGYGGDFSLTKGGVTGAGSEMVLQGLDFELFERVLLRGNIRDRFFLEFDYDSRRSEEALQYENNIYSVLYKGQGDEFLREVSAGNKYQFIQGSRYIRIDTGTPESFAVRAIAGKGNFSMEGLFRYEVALNGRKEFKGYRKNVDMRVLDVDYAKGQFFFLPDTGIDESSLLLYRSTTTGGDITVDGKKFVLLDRGEEYDFYNPSGYVYLNEALSLDQELVVRYTKGGLPVGNDALGQDAFIAPGGDGSRSDFTITNNTANNWGYFDGTNQYLYLQKKAFNSYWELRNVYYLQEIEGQSVTDVKVDLLFTTGNGVNSSYDSMPGGSSLDKDFRVDAERGIIYFTFNDGTGFYPRPFPGAAPFNPPYGSTADPANPFNPENRIYGPVGYANTADSVSTVRVQYSYTTTSFFLDYNVVPGSVEVTVNGVHVDSSRYGVEYAAGVLTFKEGVITDSSDIVVTYSYMPLGGGDKRLGTALGFIYENDRFRAQNLTSFASGIAGQEAPEAGAELPRVFKNSTELAVNFGRGEGPLGFGAVVRGGAAFSVTNRNAYGSAIIADMEKDESTFEVGLSDANWFIATHSSILPSLPLPVPLGRRGSVLYKNYWKDTVFSGEDLQTLDWAIPSENVFDYSKKAGPYVAADAPAGGTDQSLVIDYVFEAGLSDSFATVVARLPQANLSGYERFNMVLKGKEVTGTDVDVYVELLQVYDEDMNGNGVVDGEKTINDAGFPISPLPSPSAQTVIGSDREGKSNGILDSEDLNKNNLLDTGSETGVVIPGNGNDYLASLSPGVESWNYGASVSVVSLANSSIFQYANALRITVKARTAAGGSGKVVINKIWFSGSGIWNESPGYLTLSDVSVDENEEVRANAFSMRYPSLYEELHGSPSYRDRNDYVEKVLKVSLDTTTYSLPDDGSEATISRRFGSPVDLSFYKKYKMYLFVPQAYHPLPANLDFKLRFKSSENETLTATFDGAAMAAGWNEIIVDLDSPYAVTLNGTGVGTMTKTGSLKVLKRVSKVEFVFYADGGPLSGQNVEVWLDEWHAAESEGILDKAYFAEGNVDYMGTALSVRGFSVVEDPRLTVGYERLEGVFYEEFSATAGSDEPGRTLNEDLEYMSDRYYVGVDARLFQTVSSRFSMSLEDTTHFRNREEGLDTDGSYTAISYGFIFDTGKPYVPALTHTYDRTVEETGNVELTETSYRFKELDRYSDSIQVGESFNFPFGLTQSYTFLRNWHQSVTNTAAPEASLDQVSDILFSYGWERGTAALALKRLETFSGSSTLEYESWPSSYFYKMGKLFADPSKSLDGAALSSQTDSMLLSINMPINEKWGTFSVLNTDFTGSNFESGGIRRDTLASSRLFLSFPFRPFGNQMVEITPSMERRFTADYKRVGEAVSEADIILDTYAYLFMPPLFYISPIPSLGRAKDYDAVDLYKGSPDVFGTSSNTLYNRYALDLQLLYERWYVPSNVGVGFYGETARTGGTYTQTRGVLSTLSKYYPLPQAGGFFDRSLDLSLSYAYERDYAVKTIKNTVTSQTKLYLQKTEFRGVRFIHAFGYDRERQKMDDDSLSLFPDDPGSNVDVTVKPPSDSLKNSFTFEYLWELGLKTTGLIKKIWRRVPLEETVANTERVVVENVYTFTDREKYGAFSNLPVRVTLEHVSDYRVTENVEFSLNVKAVGGVEEKIVPPSLEGNFLTSMGLEAGIRLSILF